jgi:ABC-type transporter MlaC component
VLKGPGGASEDAQLARVFDSLLDYEKLAKLSLAEHWADLSEQQQKEFTATLTGLVQRAYKKNIKKTLHYEVS